jgi:hypothetical protein
MSKPVLTPVKIYATHSPLREDREFQKLLLHTDGPFDSSCRYNWVLNMGLNKFK